MKPIAGWAIGVSLMLGFGCVGPTASASSSIPRFVWNTDVPPEERLCSVWVMRDNGWTIISVLVRNGSGHIGGISCIGPSSEDTIRGSLSEPN